MTRYLMLAAGVIALAVFAASSPAALIQYDASLNGPSESTPNASPGTGLAMVDYDDVAHTLHVHVDFSGLLGTTTASHIHSATVTPGAGTAGVATTTPTFPGFPLGVTTGVYDNMLDLTLASSWNAPYITANGGTPAGAELALASSMAAGEAYLNVHTTVVPGGEIRGFLTPVPEPAALSLLVLGGLAMLRRRK